MSEQIHRLQAELNRVKLEKRPPLISSSYLKQSQKVNLGRNNNMKESLIEESDEVRKRGEELMDRLGANSSFE